jgi:hypothetical protein
MRRIVSRNSSTMEAGESWKKVYRKYMNHSWPGSLAQTPSAIQPRKTAKLPETFRYHPSAVGRTFSARANEFETSGYGI